MRRIISTLTVLIAFVSNTSVANVIYVDCGHGGSIASAIAGANAGDQIVVDGTCHEAVTITTDSLRIEGQIGAVVDAGLMDEPVISIDGARGIEIKNLEVRNGSIGINAVEKSSVAVHGVTVLDAGTNGLNIAEASNLKVTGLLSVSGSGTFAINSQDGSVVTAEGASILLNNNTFGLHAVIGSSVFINESTIEANENRFVGVAIDNNSTLFMLSSHLQANKNGLDGVGCNINSNVDVDAASSLSANDNGRHGINLQDVTFNVFSVFIIPGPSIEASNNGQNGVLLTLGSKFDIGRNSQFAALNNGANGILIDDGSTAILTDATVSGHGVDANGDLDPEIGDLQVTFGSRATAAGDTTIARVICDKSTLLRGGLVCEELEDDGDDDDD